MKIEGNLIVGQSGGPTSVINASLAGVYKTAKDLGVKTVYGMVHGIQGLLNGQYIDMSEHIKEESDIELLKRTPSAYLGSCRYKMPVFEGNEDLYEKVFSILEELNVHYFIYIGGNDSMDTIKQLSDYAAKYGKTQKFIGCPKTIDNDLAITDHTPGFGSAAKYIATSTKELICDALGLAYQKKNVMVIEIMGRNAGWLTGAAALSKDAECPGPDMIYLPELTFDMDDFMARVKALLEKKDAVIVAVSEGIKTAEGKYVFEYGHDSGYVDAFGHKLLGGTASHLCNLIAAETGAKTRAVEFSTLQRAASHISSFTDVQEAFMAGAAAVQATLDGETGKMVLFRRVKDVPYECTTDLYDIHEISNVEKTVPREWINEDGTYVTEAFINYAKPLILGEITPVYVNGVPKHIVLDEDILA